MTIQALTQRILTLKNNQGTGLLLTMQGTIFGKRIKPMLSIFDVIIYYYYYYYLIDNKTKYLGNEFQ